MEENNTELENVDTPNTEGNKSNNENKPSTSGNYVKLILLLAMVAVVLYMMFGKGNSSNDDTCTVVPQSPFGQSQQQVWIDLDTKAQNLATAGFDLEVPSEITETYTKVSYRAFTKQINEVTYYEDNGDKVIRIDKADYCGNDILEINEDSFTSINKIDVDGIEVKERGNGDLYTAISWVKGEYSYGITMYNGGITEEKVIEYVRGIE